MPSLEDLREWAHHSVRLVERMLTKGCDEEGQAQWEREAAAEVLHGALEVFALLEPPQSSPRAVA